MTEILLIAYLTTAFVTGFLGYVESIMVRNEQPWYEHVIAALIWPYRVVYGVYVLIHG